jgi:hypothetical protein
VKPIQCVTSNRDSRLPGSAAAAIICLAFMSDLSSAAPQMAADEKARAQASYSKLPLSFEANQGQTDAQVEFLSRGNGDTLFLTPTEAVLHLKKAPENDEAVLRMQMVGANPSPRILGQEALPGRVNYLIGKDPAEWLTNIPTYGKVAYEDVYPGVDLVYYGNQRHLEYDFVVAPGADPRQVKLAFKGASHIEVDSEGELVLQMANGTIHMHKRVLIYQEIDGARKPVGGGYVLKAGQTIGFQVTAYDAAHPLIINPVLVYSSYLSGKTRWGNDIAVNPRGQAYVTGMNKSPDFPDVSASQPISRDSDADGALGSGAGDNDVFIAKFNRQGSALVFLTYLGSSGGDIGYSIAVDPRGQAVVTGKAGSSDFPTKNAMQPVFGGPGGFAGDAGDAFVAQLSADGSALNYSTYLGGELHDEGYSIAVDQLGQAYVTGYTESPNFPTRNALQPTLNGRSDAFVAQFTAKGALRYSTYLGGSEGDIGYSIAVDPRGQAYVTGVTDSSSDFPIRNAVQPTFGGQFDAFVAKLSADGGTLRYATYLGGSKQDFADSIAVDPRGQAYVTGRTNSTDFPTKNAVQLVCGDRGGDADNVFFLNTFVAQLSADGSALRYSTCLKKNELL